MIIEERIAAIKAALQRAASNRATLSYGALFSAFGVDETSRTNTFDTLEAAARAISDRHTCIYEAVLAKRGTDMPSTGFFDIFMNTRPEEYDAISNGVQPNSLSMDQQREIVDLERPRVYAHATRV